MWEKEKRTSKKNMDGRSTSSHDNEKFRTRSMEKQRNGVWFSEDGDSFFFIFLLLIEHAPLLTPWCRVLLEKLTGLQLVKKFPAFHRTRRFITTLTSVRHLSLSSASPIQSIYPHPTSWRSILILSTHLRLGLPSGLLPSSFPTKTLYTPSPHPYTPHVQQHAPLPSVILHAMVTQ